MRIVRAAFPVLLSLAACGGKIDDEGMTTSSAANGPTPAQTVEASCGRTCARIHGVCTRDTAPAARCEQDCVRQFSDPRFAVDVYESCVAALSCETIAQGLFMDFGPLGTCWSRARRE